ncbi:MAG TPA: saccharopine dehydrogenase NADP-binding domain-containing protein [Thermoanaerobaculia bacterium]|nr:saccharopine dehydrogenase NADP-binding domain-containing protein [Thermoanaerobaculia bacterium]
MSIAVFGGYGTFGSLVARALDQAGLAVRILGRNGERARAFAARLGARHEGAAADATDPAACRRALEGMRVAVSCAGPFHALGLALPEACLAAGAHYVDIADDRTWFARLRRLDGRFRDAGLAAAVGCSSLPGISGALALLAAEAIPEVRAARVTLFIGNRNPKGDAAVRAAAAQLGRPFAAPQGTLRGYQGREVVRLPPPFGARAVYDVDSPELDLFPALIGAREVRVKVGFEARMATASIAALAHLGPRWGGALTRAMLPIARPLSRFGHSGGFVQVELWGADGASVASLGSGREGQRMAALPAAFAAEEMLREAAGPRGVLTAWEVLGARPLLAKLESAGYELREELTAPRLLPVAAP